MCEACGCGHVHDRDAALNKPDAHSHDAPAAGVRTLDARASILSRNDRLAEQNRGMFLAHRLIVINLLSAPGAGKTTLLERTFDECHTRWRMAVIVGDLATDNDARRLRREGIPAIQITTGTACHLDAHMVRHALETLDLAALDLLFIENVGNLVCPADFDLGENARVVLFAVTEGEDKPLKYPVIFHDADAVVVNKLDLAGAVGFPRDTALGNLHAAAPHAAVLELSARTGVGMQAWYAWLAGRIAAR